MFACSWCGKSAAVINYVAVQCAVITNGQKQLLLIGSEASSLFCERYCCNGDFESDEQQCYLEQVAKSAQVSRNAVSEIEYILQCR